MQALIQELKEELLEVIQIFNSKGWSPATSTNYSFRHPADNNLCIISRSGVDKSQFTESDLMTVDTNGKPKALYSHLKPSAETGLHTMLYRIFPEVNAVFHTHAVTSTVISKRHKDVGYVILEDYEVLKGLEGITTHETRVEIPVFRNAQDIVKLSSEIENYLLALHENIQPPGFLLASHGLYAWGKTIAEAKRHVEVFEFLFECELLYRS